MSYEVVIGMEVHAQLLTKTKLFCSCSTSYGASPNTQVCPVCISLPGVLPVLNKKAVEFVVRTGLALNCEIARMSLFSRKNYFYPDLPKNYQISQYDLPLCFNGYLDLSLNSKTERVKIRRVHLEEDAGKLLHSGSSFSEVDLNRTGVPLMEVVTEPCITSPQLAHLYLTKLRNILLYLGVCNGNMEEGSLRCEPNISLRPKGEVELGVKTELKNLNSFKAVYKGLEYEIKRQREILESGGKVTQDTCRWDEKSSSTISMRSKEEAHDYRYFPEPDLLPLVIPESWEKEIKESLPELPEDRKRRFMEEFSLPEYDAGVITDSKSLADYYEECLKYYKNPKIVSNWVMGEFLRLLKLNEKEVEEAKISSQNLGEMLKMIEKGIISGKIAKTIFEEMFNTGKSPQIIVEERGLTQISDEEEIGKVVDKIIKENPEVVESFKGGKEKSIGFLVGQVMKETQGRANPKLVNKLLRERLIK